MVPPAPPAPLLPQQPQQPIPPELPPQQQQPVLPQQQQQQPLLPLLPNIPPMHAGGDSPERVYRGSAWYAEQRWFTELSPYFRRDLKNPTLVEMKAFGSTDAAMQHLYDLLKNKNESVHKLVGINNGLNKRLHSMSASFTALKKQCNRPKRLPNTLSNHAPTLTLLISKTR